MKLKKMTDEECIKTFLEMMETRVSVTTHFVNPEDDDGVLTHQVMEINCGDYNSHSYPQPLAVPLRPATGAEVGATVN